MRRVVEPKKDIHDYYYWVWFLEQQKQVQQQQVGVGDEGLQLTRGFGSEIYLPYSLQDRSSRSVTSYSSYSFIFSNPVYRERFIASSNLKEISRVNRWDIEFQFSSCSHHYPSQQATHTLLSDCQVIVCISEGASNRFVEEGGCHPLVINNSLGAPGREKLLHATIILFGRGIPTSWQSFSSIGHLLLQKHHYLPKEGTHVAGRQTEESNTTFRHSLHASYLWSTISLFISGMCISFSWKS